NKIIVFPDTFEHTETAQNIIPCDLQYFSVRTFCAGKPADVFGQFYINLHKMGRYYRLYL
ncbi:MAG: hypothetical protein WAZ19_15820, partial [Anaerolineae bacterium]